MSLRDVRAALEGRLNSIAPALPTAWENVDFDPPTDGGPYQKIHLLPAEPDNQEYGSMFTEQGLLQVTLHYPLGDGPGDALDRAQLIRNQFRRGTSIVKNGTTVTVHSTPEIGVALPDDAFYLVPVRIRWYANVTG